jgi:hypothetical protein
MSWAELLSTYGCNEVEPDRQVGTTNQNTESCHRWHARSLVIPNVPNTSHGSRPSSRPKPKRPDLPEPCRVPTRPYIETESRGIVIAPPVSSHFAPLNFFNFSPFKKIKLVRSDRLDWRARVCSLAERGGEARFDWLASQRMHHLTSPPHHHHHHHRPPPTSTPSKCCRNNATKSTSASVVVSAFVSCVASLTGL